MIPTCPIYPRLRALTLLAGVFAVSVPIQAQLIDRTMAPNAANEGIAKSYSQQIGAGRGNITTPNSSAFIIARDPARSVRRGRQLFQRKFIEAQGAGPIVGHGSGDIGNNIAIGAGLSDSCAACHGRPRGSAGVGGDVATRPDSRDAPHLFGAGLKEMLADEFTTELRRLRDEGITRATTGGGGVPTTYQAESAVLAGGTVSETTNAGFNGTGYANSSLNGGSITFTVDGNGGGTKNLAIRYALGATGARTGTLTVNGANRSITFAPTGAFTTWVTLNVSVTLLNGTNTIRFASTGNDLGNIDQITVPPTAGSPGPVTVQLTYQGINYGSLSISSTGVVDTSRVVGVDPDLRVRPFFAAGEKFSLRESAFGAFNDEMGLQTVDPEFGAARAGGRMVSLAGMVFDGSRDRLEPIPTTSPTADPDRDGVVNEIPVAIIDHMEFYLLNYFKPATYEQTPATIRGRQVFATLQCVRCHVPDLTIQRDRRVADVETVFDPVNGIFNGLFGTAATKFNVTDDGSGHPTLKTPQRGTFVVRNFFSDMKRHDLGPRFHERNYNGTTQTTFVTMPLWGVGTTAPYGHDGRSINLAEVILRHGGEAQAESDRFAALADADRGAVLEFLNSLVLFPPDDTASTLDPGNRAAVGFPQFGHGAFRLGALFNNPADPE